MGRLRERSGLNDDRTATLAGNELHGAILEDDRRSGNLALALDCERVRLSGLGKLFDFGLIHGLTFRVVYG